MAGIGILGRFLGNTVSEGAAFAAGYAIGPVLEPPLRLLRNTINEGHAYVYPGAGELALGVAQGQVDEPTARKWAAYHGVGHDAFSALVQIANTGPGVSAAFELWRRAKIDDAGFRRALTRAAIEPEWITALIATKYHLLDPAAIANAVQQGHLPNEGILPDPVFGDGLLDIPLTQINLDPVELAKAQGIDLDTLRVMANLSGLPPPQGELRDMLNRGIITEAAFEAGIREGHTKTKWIGAVRRLARRILSPDQYVQGHLRGWIDEAAMHAGAALHGMTPEDTDLLFKIHGAPPSWHQVWIGLQRGGVYDGPTGELDPAFLKALQEGNTRPEWYNLLWASRYNYPSPFVLKSMAQGGDLTAPQLEQILRYLGWEPTFASRVSKRWTTSTSTAAKEATAADLVTLYQGYKISRAELLAKLEAAGYQADQAELKVEVADAARVKAARDTAITGLHTAFKKGQLDASYPAGTTTATPAQRAAAEQAGADRAALALAALGLPEWEPPLIVAAWRIERDAADLTLALVPIPTP